jgi:DNA-binding PadR family transcriptional regulator
MTARQLNDLELFVLLAVIRLGEGAYGVSIAREIESAGRRSISLAAVYAVLDRMEEGGLVTSRLGEATPERGGRSKRYFGITEQGFRCVRASREALMSMWQGVPEFEGGAV